MIENDQFEDYQSDNEGDAYSEEEEYSEDEYSGISVKHAMSGTQLRNVAHNAQPLSKKMYQPKNDKYLEDKIDLRNHTLFSSDSTANKTKDKQDRATFESAIDKRTLIALTKLLRKKEIDCVNGCLSTGKEANVYHALTKDNLSMAIKIFRTSVQTFKHRQPYIEGEFRFRHRSLQKNTRSMVYLWAEKEYRNLLRINQIGMPCPKPKMLIDNIILMEFIGEDERPAPLLRNVMMNESLARTLYRECVVLIWELFNEAELVHCDLSEYNLLYHQNKIVLIDVSAAIEKTNEKATNFLKEDCFHINSFFRSKNVAVMTLKELFDLITNPDINKDNFEEYLLKAQKIASSRTQQELNDLKHEDMVFRNVYTVPSLNQLERPEEDHENRKHGVKDSDHSTIKGLKPNPSKGKFIKKALKNIKIKEEVVSSDDETESGSNDEEDSEEDNSEDDSDDDDETTVFTEKKVRKVKAGARPRDESPSSRKLRKQGVKEQRSESRKQKKLLKEEYKKKAIQRSKKKIYS